MKQIYTKSELSYKHPFVTRNINNMLKNLPKKDMECLLSFELDEHSATRVFLTNDHV